jgi:hypothetical protein
VLLEALLDRIQGLLADIAYAAKVRLLDRLKQRRVEAVIQPESNQKKPGSSTKASTIGDI